MTSPSDHAVAALHLMRSLIDRIELKPEGSGPGLSVELYGELAAIINLGDEPKRKVAGLGRPATFSLVAGEGFEPPTLGL